MKTSYETVGVEEWLKKVKAHPGIIMRETESVLKQEARQLCVEYARRSGPGKGTGETPIDKGKEQVETDVRRVFATRDSPNRVFDMLKKHSTPEIAKAYWHAYKSKKPLAMAKILKQAALPEGMSAAAQRAARTAPHGRVPKDFDHVSLANSASVKVLIRELQKRVGMAKAGWYCAAIALGGQVRGAYTNAEGVKVIYQKFASSVRLVARRFPGIGGATVTKTGTSVDVSIYTYLGHAPQALSERHVQEANAEASAKLALAFGVALQKVNSETFK
jgi:hypothetical protein